MRIALIGYGYWGPHYARIVGELPDVKLAAICDTDQCQRMRAMADHPGVPVFSDMFHLGDVDAVIVSTPASTHHEIAVRLLTLGKHVLLEKPMALNIKNCERLQYLSKYCGKVLMVGHTFLYNSGIRGMKEQMHSPSFGDTIYLHSTRTNAGPVRKDVDVLFDLAPHDVSIFNYLLDAQPVSVSAVGSRHVVFMTLRYPGQVLANIHVSWLDPNKVREVVAVGTGRRIVYDDLKPETFYEEPLKTQLRDFLRAIKGDHLPLSDGSVGENVVRVLAAARASMASGGAPQEIPSRT